MKQNKKPCITTKVIGRRKRSKTLSEEKPVEKISKKLQKFQEISPMQKEFLPSRLSSHYKASSYKKRKHKKVKAYRKSSKKEPTAKRYLLILGLSRFVSHRATISGEFDSRKDSQSTKFKRRPRLFIKLSFRELCDSKLSGLHAFDNMAIIDLVYIGKK